MALPPRPDGQPAAARLGPRDGVHLPRRQPRQHRVVEQFLGMGRATDLDEFQQVFAEVQGLPWVNTLAADRIGPRLVHRRVGHTAAQHRCPAPLRRPDHRTTSIAGLLYENRVALLDGSDPDDEWLDDPDARGPGLEPFSELPQLERRDVLVNANDSHWLDHGGAAARGLTRRSTASRAPPARLRTRQNLLRRQRLAARGGATRDDLIDVLFANDEPQRRAAGRRGGRALPCGGHRRGRGPPGRSRSRGRRAGGVGPAL